VVREINPLAALGNPPDPAEFGRIEIPGDKAVAKEVRARFQLLVRMSTAKFGSRRASRLSVVQTASQSLRFAAAMWIASAVESP
jgi:hypothetical protein